MLELAQMGQSSEVENSPAIEEELEVFSQYLKKGGLKMTRQRQLVVESFLLAGGHLSTEDPFVLPIGMPDASPRCYENWVRSKGKTSFCFWSRTRMR